MAPFQRYAACVLTFLLMSSSRTSIAWTLRSYIVYLGNYQQHLGEERIISSHHEMLTTVLGSSRSAKESILYSYKHGFNGFSAILEPEQASAISAMPGVISVFPNTARVLHTTDSWQFLGLVTEGVVPNYSIWTKADYGTDVIIGLLDTGVWPESDSFNDDGIGPIPSRWKGLCQTGTDFNTSNCNRKLIGARYFIKGYEAANGPLNITATGDFLSPRDMQGHGTHTSSTAGGRFVQGANIFGFANGTASGGAPLSRIAIYKVCWPAGCWDADILAAYDMGLHDGVDVFSISLGLNVPSSDYFSDSIAIGGFHATQRNKIVVCSAGNEGPSVSSVINAAPWLVTVAASSIDRDFPSYAVLGNNKRFRGSSLSDNHLQHQFYPLVSAVDVKTSNANASSSQLCFPNSLDPERTKGKIVACLRGITARVDKGVVVQQAGGIGMILCNAPTDENELIADAHVLPATQLSAADGASVFEYINFTRSPMAYITYPRTVLKSQPAPVMASFSSQGPNIITPDILKPDITAPGLNILAAWTEKSGPTDLDTDYRHVKYNILSGTSMSCPHVAGIASLLKALHPDWSSAAIKSAIMTSATQMDNSNHLIRNGSLYAATPFNYGAGHVHPNAAADPGLVYNVTDEDYFLFLCSLNHNISSLRMITQNNSTCPTYPPKVSDLNYPSITLSNLKGSETVTRTLTNVGQEGTYKVVVSPPPGIDVSISPSELSFSKGERKRFYVMFRVKTVSHGQYVFGHFTWGDGRHFVRSPMSVNATSIHQLTSD